MKVMIVDDMALLRDGLARSLRDRGVDVVAEMAGPEGVLEAVAGTTPDVVIVDIRMPPTFTDEGLTLAADLRRRFDTLGVLVLSQHLESSYAMRLLRDAPERSGYLLKDRIMHLMTLIDALERIAEGETVIDPTIVSRIMGRTKKTRGLDRLSAREFDVLALLAEGLSNRAIGERLHVNERTVETHITQVFTKLGLESGPATHRRVLAVLTFLRTGVT
jgi:DNA-binding NarL/FixJ family response regulator